MRAAKLAALVIGIVWAGTIWASSAFADFGLAETKLAYEDPFGAPLLQAGGHPDSKITIAFNRTTNPGGESIMDGQVRDIEVNLPAGFYGNPRVAKECQLEIFLQQNACDPGAQVGVWELEVAPGFFFPLPVYNMQSPNARTAVLAIVAFGVPAEIVISARTGGDFGLIAKVENINQAFPLTTSVLTLWGTPADPVHDPLRYGPNGPGYSAGIPPKPFLTLPTSCEPMTTTLRADSWQNPGAWKEASETTPPLEGCDQLDFRPSLKARPTTDVADSPSGLEADLSVPQNVDGPAKPSSAMPKATEVDLPEGLVINPSAANGLDACTPAQIGLTTSVGDEDPHFSEDPASCPDASKIGRVEVKTQVFDQPLVGTVYVMQPHQNPFGSLLGVYLAIEGRGLVIKQAGKVTADPATGRLHASFNRIPRLPFEELKLNFDGGAFGILRTPAGCGPYSTDAVITPWSTPGTPTVSDTDSYAITRSPSAGSCASSESARPNSPAFEAGATTAVSGAYSPFVLKLSREDGTQQLTGIDATLPPGLLAKLAGTAYCPEAVLIAASHEEGRQEQRKPSCPASSKVGAVTVGAGAGPKPFYAQGAAYLAGPYKGAPVSLAVVVPAVAGPFDLGTVVVRSALQVDPATAQVRAVSDRFPTILQGIPLDLRSVDLRLDRKEFTKNPTSCDPFAITGFAATLSGQSALLSDHFQVGECGHLAFGPKLRIGLKGKTKRTGNPALTAVLTQKPGQANIRNTTVVLPQSMFIDNTHIATPCTRVQFNAGECPKSSILGHARAFSPLLGQPLRGPVYFRSNGGERELPDLVADLDGQIHVTLVGFIDSVKTGPDIARVRTRFATVPDAPISKFVLRMAGGKKGLLENSINLCVSPQVARARMSGQNGKQRNSQLRVGIKCRHGGKKGRKGHGA